VLAVPSDYVEIKSVYIDGSPVVRLQRQTVDYIYEKYPIRSSTGKPTFIAREGSNFIFGPFPSSDYTVKGIYYARLTSLSASNTTNWFTANAPDILLWASLCEAEPFLKNDERTVVWEAKYQAAKSAIEDEDKKEQRSGSPLTAKASYS